MNNILKIYDIDREKNFKNFQIHQDEINDLLKIDEKKFISSSKDKTISFNEFKSDFLSINILKVIRIHVEGVNQTIKLKLNLYASCSNDKTIKIWEFENDNYNIKKNLRGHETEVLSIYKLEKDEIVSISKGGFLKFWENENCLKTLEICEIPLHNCISLLNKHIISVGTNKSIIFIDFIKKEKIKKYPLDSPASSILNFFGNLLFAQKNNETSYYLREYTIIEKNSELDIECIGKGKDKTIEIPYIQTINENEIVTSNKTKSIKIWERTEKIPEILQFEEFRNKVENLKLKQEMQLQKEKDNEEKKEENVDVDIFNKNINYSGNIICGKQLKIISFLLEKCICKISFFEKTGTGFFCKIPYQSKQLPVLITCNHIFNEDIQKNNNIVISINDNKEKRAIKIDENRKVYSNEELDITFIEIIQEKDKIYNFLEIDELPYNKEYDKNIPIYVLYYSCIDKMAGMSTGFIKKIKENNLIYDATTNSGAGGAPIILLKNNKVIGIHIGMIEQNESKEKMNKLGSSIKAAYMAFNNDIKKNDLLNKSDIMNYDSNIKKLHFMISQYYGNENYKNIYYFLEVILEELKKDKDFKIDSDFEQSLSLFEAKIDNNELASVLKNYKFFMILNKWLMNSQKLNYKLLDSIAFFTSRIMYSLDLYGTKNNQYFKNETTLYRGLKMYYESLILYERLKGKIILIPAFTSCSESKEIAEEFSKITNGKSSLFSVIFYIKFNHKENWISNGINVQKISQFSEKEILIQPFSFFFVRDIQIDNEKHFANIYLETIGRKQILENEIKKG